MHLVLRPVRFPLLSLDLGPARGVEVSQVTCLVRASTLLSLLLLRELKRGELLIRSRHPLSALLPRWPLPAHHCTLCDVVSRESLPWSAPVHGPLLFPNLRIEEQGRIVAPALGRAAPAIGLGVLVHALLPARGQERRRRDSSRSLSSRVRSRRDRSRSSDRYRSRRVRSRSVSRRNQSRSSDRYRSCRDHSRRDWPCSSERYQSRRERSRSPAHRGGRRDRERSRDPPRCSRDSKWSLLSSDRSRSEERSRRARREQREGGTTVTVSQASVVSEAAATVAPPVVGGTIAALPSAVQDLAKFFLSLTGSSSQGAVGSIAGAAVPTSGASAPGVGAVASCAATAPSAGAEKPPPASAAVPGSSGRQQREEDFSRRSRRQSPGFARAAGSSRSPSDALSAVASQGALVPRVRPFLSSGAFASGSETGSVLVDGEGPSLDRGSIRDTCSGSSPVFGHVLFRVGRSPPRSTRVRVVVGPGVVVAYQSSRDEGTVLGPSVVSRRCHRSSRDMMCDNSTVVAYVNKQGGTVSRALCSLASRLLRWTEILDTHLDTRYLPGQANVLADLLSHHGQVVGTEWSLHPQVARSLLRVWGNPSIDLFVKSFNAKLPLYCSLVRIPRPSSRTRFVILGTTWTCTHSLPFL